MLSLSPPPEPYPTHTDGDDDREAIYIEKAIGNRRSWCGGVCCSSKVKPVEERFYSVKKVTEREKKCKFPIFFPSLYYALNLFYNVKKLTDQRQKNDVAPEG
ncbi:hypothetical protein LOK49_LG06G03274 [Camellia lanceoleosa]|uniref:Uncharacterized protein n=1 Tax=Camellia lanceoleosa TaxID=1840588 RepID=A0ACC0H961_9ERIC|nr:hypothetical protein LOK49_LG06G03274 [Camellia lanceoleosa]